MSNSQPVPSFSWQIMGIMLKQCFLIIYMERLFHLKQNL